MKSIIDELQKIIDQYEIENKAYKHCLEWMKYPDSDLPENIIEKIKIRFRHHKFYFKHGHLDYAYIETRLDLLYEDNEIGNYGLISLTNGEIVDDYFEIYNNMIKFFTEKR